MFGKTYSPLETSSAFPLRMIRISLTAGILSSFWTSTSSPFFRPSPNTCLSIVNTGLPSTNSASDQLKFILRIYNFHYFVVVVLFLGIGLGACSSKEIGPNYSYPTGSQQRVLELCALVYSDPYYQYISPSRRVKLRRIRTTSWGFWATFEDGRTYKVPIVTDLPGGKNYYCIYRPPPTACASRNDWDERCEWDQTYHPNRFQ